MRRGIVLISVLFGAILVLMFATAAVSLAPGVLGRASQQADRAALERAQQAAVEWARVRLRQSSTWHAEAEFDHFADGLAVHEDEGQVVGWVQEGERWSRFRYSFNREDGAGGPDGLPNSSAPWADFTLLSSNNLGSAGEQQVPPSLTLPPHSVLLSVEGTTGSPLLVDGRPVDFVSQRRGQTLRAVLGLNQANDQAPDAATMCAGPMNVNLGGDGELNLDATLTQATRVRTRGPLNVNGSVDSVNGELLVPDPGAFTGPLPDGVRLRQENPNNDFLKLALDQVRQPVNQDTLPAGVYVLKNGGELRYYPQDYQSFRTAQLAGTLGAGQVVTMPSGWQLLPDTDPTTALKYTVRVNKDLEVQPVGGLTDFAFVPDGGADESGGPFALQSATTGGGGGSATATTGTTGATTQVTAATDTGGMYVVDTVLVTDAFNGLMYNGTTGMTQGSGPVANAALRALLLTLTPGDFHLSLPDNATLDYDETTGIQANNWDKVQSGAHLANIVMEKMQTGDIAVQTAWQDFYNASRGTGTGAGTGGEPTSSGGTGTDGLPTTGSQGTGTGGTATSGGTTTTPGLKPNEVCFEAAANPSGSTAIVAPGNLTLGATVVGHGASLISKGGKIQLLGTSSELSATASQRDGINMYARDGIVVDAYHLDPAGGAFRSVSFKGVVYTWGNIDLRVGHTGIDRSKWGSFKLEGAMVAYGGDPSQGPPDPSLAHIDLLARDANLQFNPAYLPNLMNQLPQPLGFRILAWRHD